MPPEKLNDRLWSWASIIDDVTLRQAEMTARLPILAGHLALMPDAHLGIGATIGTVIPTETAVIPSAVGVDIGCGMAARKLHLLAESIDWNDLEAWVHSMNQAVPAGLGHWHAEPSPAAEAWFDAHPPPPTLENPGRAVMQLGTLGSGNHFIELASDTEGWLWILLHSGSRGGGNKLATIHTRIAKRVCAHPLEDRDLAWLDQGTPEFDAYLRDLSWSQAYASVNRGMMLEATHNTLETVLEAAIDVAQADVNCHHNYTELERHGDRMLWVTRKGAIRAGVGDYGLIPGSMGQRSFVVRGLGNEASYQSCSHGAGRVMSRKQARRTLSVDDFEPFMADTAWQREHAEALLDEHPAAYKDIDVVMRDQADLVEVVTELHTIANYKGTS